MQPWSELSRYHGTELYPYQGSLLQASYPSDLPSSERTAAIDKLHINAAVRHMFRQSEAEIDMGLSGQDEFLGFRLCCTDTSDIRVEGL